MDLGKRYFLALEQLMPKGWAWSGRECHESVLSRLLRSVSDELARFHVWYERQLRSSIERFLDIPQGWSANDYELLLSNKFNIQSSVIPYTEADDPHMLHISQRNHYFFCIELDDDQLVRFDASVSDYLEQYKQSHTDFWVKIPPRSVESKQSPNVGVLMVAEQPELLIQETLTNTSPSTGFFIFAKEC